MAHVWAPTAVVAAAAEGEEEPHRLGILLVVHMHMHVLVRVGGVRVRELLAHRSQPGLDLGCQPPLAPQRVSPTNGEEFRRPNGEDYLIHTRAHAYTRSRMHSHAHPREDAC
jgi:hypothetical protein